MLNVIMLNVVMLNVVMLSVIMPSVVVQEVTNIQAHCATELIMIVKKFLWYRFREGQAVYKIVQVTFHKVTFCIQMRH